MKKIHKFIMKKNLNKIKPYDSKSLYKITKI